ncbi:MAG: hypothetical protein AAFX99_22835 [Myxococcota bacterium]
MKPILTALIFVLSALLLLAALSIDNSQQQHPSPSWERLPCPAPLAPSPTPTSLSPVPTATPPLVDAAMQGTWRLERVEGYPEPSYLSGVSNVGIGLTIDAHRITVRLPGSHGPHVPKRVTVDYAVLNANAHRATLTLSNPQTLPHDMTLRTPIPEDSHLNIEVNGDTLRLSVQEHTQLVFVR